MYNPFKQVEMFEADYQEFEKLVKEVWPEASDYSFVADEELMNDISKEYSADTTPPDNYDQEQLDKFANGNDECYMAQTLIDALCRIGILQPGRYIIHVSW